jgi:hypothetical protein
MRDLVLLVLTVAVFAALVGLVALCDRIVGDGDTAEATRTQEPERVLR